MLIVPKTLNFIHNWSEDAQSRLADFFSFLYVKIYLAFIIIINFFIWLIAYHFNKELDLAQAVLHYNVDFGVNLIGPAKELYIIPILGIIIFLFNVMIILIIGRDKEIKFLANLLLIAALLSNLILLIAAIAVYLINFR